MLHSKRGFSLVELLVVVAIIGVLAAIAIPAYQGYQADARESVIDSALQTAGRTININQSIGKETTTSDLDSKVRSKGNSVGSWTTIPSPVGIDATGDWCVSVSPSLGTGFVSGCLTKSGVKSFAGAVDCTKYTTIDISTTSTPNLVCEAHGCNAAGSANLSCTGTGVTATGECQSAAQCK